MCYVITVLVYINKIIYYFLYSKVFWSISRDVESFSSLRHQFITSYATMCSIHWLLGIGDRHLENTLICERTGRSIGIDFGYAFDTSVSIQCYPELVPFRLTPHILNLIEPLREHGFIELTMVNCLKALRNEKDILLSAMNIFINEPTMNWIESIENKDENNSFDAHVKLTNAKKKLSGCNPVQITIDELSKRNLEEETFSLALKEIAQGTEQFNIRRRLPSEGLTVENQVKCLLDQATDYNILGRTYDGYESFI